MFPACPSRPQLCRAVSESDLHAIAELQLGGSSLEDGSDWLRRASSDTRAPKIASKSHISVPRSSAAAARSNRRVKSKSCIEVAWQEDGRGGFTAANDVDPSVKCRLVVGNFKVPSRDHVPLPPARLTCGSWVILDGSNKRIIAEFNSREVRGMASLTKMMTCAIILRLAEANPQLLQARVVVTLRAVEVGRLGTTAALRLGEVLTVSDLLYAMMLPSGNDAASLLAQAFGPHIEIQRNSPKKKRSPMKDVSNTEGAASPSSPGSKLLRKYHALSGSTMSLSLSLNLSLLIDPSAVGSAHYGDCVQAENDFVARMNQVAGNQGMKDTHFCNPHGLGHPLHNSSARSLAFLSHEVMKLPLMRNIVATKEYKCSTTLQDGRVFSRVWSSTNKLLGNYGYDGIKTGITPTAGGCLASRFWRGDRQFIIVTLGSNCENTRFTDTTSLMRWVWKAVLLES
jgi:D-alanyl-D-alanine carboxypeptidase